MQMKAVSGNGN